MFMYGLRGSGGGTKRKIGIVEENETAKENNGDIVQKVRRQRNIEGELENKTSREEMLENRDSGIQIYSYLGMLSNFFQLIQKGDLKTGQKFKLCTITMLIYNSGSIDSLINFEPQAENDS